MQTSIWRALRSAPALIMLLLARPTRRQPNRLPSVRRCRCLAAAVTNWRPACAIGGVTLDNAANLIAAGTSLLAVITDLFEAPDITLRALAFQQLFEGERA